MWHLLAEYPLLRLYFFWGQKMASTVLFLQNNTRKHGVLLLHWRAFFQILLIKYLAGSPHERKSQRVFKYGIVG